jgi:hypothetical protein
VVKGITAIAFTVVLTLLMVVVWALSSFLLGAGEVAILLGAALLVATLIARKMKRAANRDLSVARIFQGVIAGFLALSIWSAQGPSKKQLLGRHLGITNSSEFHVIRTQFHSAREWTAWIYLEGSRESIERVLADQKFMQPHPQALGFVDFKKAPPPPAASEALTYWRHGRATMDYAVTAPGSTQLWFTAHRL